MDAGSNPRNSDPTPNTAANRSYVLPEKSLPYRYETQFSASESPGDLEGVPKLYSLLTWKRGTIPPMIDGAGTRFKNYED